MDAIHGFLSRSYWAEGIPSRVVERAIANSICCGAFADGRQVGFARAVTDQATFAYLADIYVLEEHRGQGLAQRMVKTLLGRAELQGLRRMLLITRDAHGLYAKFGFKPLAKPGNVMEAHVPDVYRR